MGQHNLLEIWILSNLLDTNTLANKSIQLSAANLLELISWTARTSAETVGMVDLLRLVELSIAKILQQAKPKSNRSNTSKYRATKRHIGYYLINFMIDDVTQLFVKLSISMYQNLLVFSYQFRPVFCLSDQTFHFVHLEVRNKFQRNKRNDFKDYI